MPTREIVGRVRYAVYCRAERQAYRLSLLTPATRLRDALHDRLRRGDWEANLLSSRDERRADFFAGTAERERMRELFERQYCRERRSAVAAAERVMRGEVEFFGQTFSIEPAAAWTKDPVSGAAWPQRYHRDVPIYGGNRGWGDVKYVWELNRQQFLIDLGRAAFLTGDPKYAAKARDLVANWLTENPYATGVNWACALEPAFRVLSWLWTYFLCYDEERRHHSHHLLWLTGFCDHGRFLHRHLELYASPYNHLIGECSALYILGVLFPEFREAAAWKARAKELLETRVSDQFYADGGTREQSTFYHHATLAFYLLSALLARRHNEELSPAVWNSIERAIGFSAALVLPDGRTPAIGGADDGRPLRMEHLPLWDFRPFQAIGSVLFHRPDFKHIAGRFFEDALWVLGPDGLTRFEELPAQPTAPASLALPESGYYVLRTDWSDQADYVCVDCGEQAGDIRTDAVPNSVHGHADCLSIVVALAGRPVLVDSGLFCYNCDSDWETHFRRTAAHNTARIDGADQAQHLGKMAWAHSYIARAELWQVRGNEAAFIGSHDGYTRRGGDTIHRRLAWLRTDGYLIVYDEFDCHREHDVELGFQFAPGSLRLVRPGLAVYDHGVQFAWVASAALRGCLHEGGPEPAQGWIATSLGVRVPAPRLTLSGRIGPGAAVLSVLTSPRKAGGLDVRVLADDATQSATGILKISGPDFDDYVGASAITPRQLPGETDGRVAVWRFRDGHNVDAFQVGGTYVRPASQPPPEETAS